MITLDDWNGTEAMKRGDFKFSIASDLSDVPDWKINQILGVWLGDRYECETCDGSGERPGCEFGDTVTCDHCRGIGRRTLCYTGNGAAAWSLLVRLPKLDRGSRLYKTKTSVVTGLPYSGRPKRRLAEFGVKLVFEDIPAGLRDG